MKTSLISQQNGGSDYFLERVEGTTKGNIKTKGMICEYIAFIVFKNIINYTAYYWNVLYDVGPHNT